MPINKFQTVIFTILMALLWQLFVAGPFVRFIFRGLFSHGKKKVAV